MKQLSFRGCRGGGALRLPDGSELAVTARPPAHVAFRGGALELRATLPASGRGPGVELAITHPFGQLRHLFLPYLAPHEGEVMGDRVFRAPAVVFATATVALAFVVDVDDLAAARGFRAFLDYDHPRRVLRFGAGSYRLVGHVFFAAEPLEHAGQEVRLRLHVLASRRPRDLTDPYAMAASFLWRAWGARGHAAGGSQRAPFARYVDHVARFAFAPGWGDVVWQRFELGGEPAAAPTLIVDAAQHPSVPANERRWRERRSVWNQLWFSTQRCANGLLRYGRQIGSVALEEHARLATRVALAAPQTDGLFPSVYGSGPIAPYTLESELCPWDAATWTNSDRRPPSASADACHIADAAHTCRMLGEWRALTGEAAAITYVRPFVERLLRLQLPSGAFPGWVEPDGRVVPELAESAETAVGAALLFELGGAELRAAAFAALAFLEGVVAAGRWEDFETYYSCSSWGRELRGRRVPRNGVHKQNTLSIAWCAEAFLLGYRASGEARHLRLARRCLDELSLYQAVWDPAFLPAPAHGGFGVMNADSEWNDARQCVFAPLYLDFYRETGDAELFERGVAALRAAFSMLYCPENGALRAAYERRHPLFGPESFGFMMENQGHGAGDPVGPFAIFSWGNGLALAAAATVRDLYGDVYVDAKRRAAFGLDGCEAHVLGERVEVESRYERATLTAVYAGGGRHEIALERRCGVLPLRGVASLDPAR